MQIKVTGLKEVEATLQSLGSKAGTKILRQSMLAAARPILNQAKANAESIKEGSGALHKSLGSRFYAGARNVADDSQVLNMGGRFTVSIAPIKRNRVAVALHNLFYGRKRRGIFYGHLLEFGHADRAGKSVPARPFLKPALDSRGSQAVSTLADQLRARIARHLKQTAKK